MVIRKCADRRNIPKRKFDRLFFASGFLMLIGYFYPNIIIAYAVKVTYGDAYVIVYTFVTAIIFYFFLWNVKRILMMRPKITSP